MINKAKFDSFCQDYEVFLKAKQESDFLLWECQANWQKTWDIEELDFKYAYDTSLKSMISVRLWKHDAYFPKEMMLRFIELDKEFARSIFRDLFDEAKDIDGRISRFVFHCDMFLEELRKKDMKADSHYHADLFMPSLYLSFRYPEHYAPYQFEVFSKFMDIMGARKIPVTNDIGRYFKVMRVVHKLLSSQEHITSTLDQGLSEVKSYKSKSLMMAYDFALYCIQKNG